MADVSMTQAAKPLTGLRVAGMALFGLGISQIWGGPAFAAERYAAIVIDAQTGDVLEARNADDKRYPASITKVMTLYMLFDALERGDVRLTSRIPFSRKASRTQASKLYIRAGQSISVEEAILALVVKSANDVAVAVAEKLGGTEANFALRMTRKAQALGMVNTRFANASGLPNPQNYSTASDIAIMAQAILRDHPQYYHYFSTPSFRFRSALVRTHNRLLGTVDGVDGLKTGVIDASGYNMVTSAVRDGKRLIFVVLGGQTAAARDYHMAQLVEAGFLSVRAIQSQPPEIAYAAFRSIPPLGVGAAELNAAQLARLDRPAPADAIGIGVDSFNASGAGDVDDNGGVEDFNPGDSPDGGTGHPDDNAVSSTFPAGEASQTAGRGPVEQGDREDPSPIERDLLRRVRVDMPDPYTDFGVY